VLTAARPPRKFARRLLFKGDSLSSFLKHRFILCGPRPLPDGCGVRRRRQAENCQRCADSGVLGPVPGVMGTMQALEAIKLLAGVGCPLTGKLLMYDALFASFHTIKLRARDPTCAVCGDHPTVRNALRRGIGLTGSLTG
jgi:molybdopterin/thiamine biosynthesis adenylyltransferase